jgi:capsular polysaccharide biosynthesis protein
MRQEVGVLEGKSPNGTRRNASLAAEYDAGWTATVPPQGEDALSIRDLFRTIWQRLWIIVLVALLFVGAAVGFGLYQTPMYEASIKVLVGQKQGLTDTPGDVIGLQQLTQTITELADTRTVADAVIQQHDLKTPTDEFLETMSVEPIGETQVIEISYTDPDPRQASAIANTIGEVVSEQVSEVSSNANSITATSVESAVVPENPVSPNLLLNGILALFVGTILGVGLAFLLEQLDDRWRSPEEAMQISGVPTLATVREFKLPKRNRRKETV